MESVKEEPTLGAPPDGDDPIQQLQAYFDHVSQFKLGPGLFVFLAYGLSSRLIGTKLIGLG